MIASKIHHIVYALALTIVGVAAVWGYVSVHRTPVVADTRINQLESEVHGLTQAASVLAASYGRAPVTAAPAVTVLREIPGLSGFSPAQVAQILAGLKAPTRPVIGARLVGPKPTSAPVAPAGWTQAQIDAIYNADIASTEKVLASTHIAVSVTREEVQPTRIGSMLTPSGSGLGFAAVRKGHLELDLGAVVRGTHLSPALSPAYLIPHTAVGCGPSVIFDKSAIVGAACTIHF